MYTSFEYNNEEDSVLTHKHRIFLGNENNNNAMVA